MIHFSQVSKRYTNSREALTTVSFDLEKGEMAFLTGHSGAGKSTLLKLIALIERPTTGEIVFDGINISRLKNSKIPLLRRKIGLIFQDPNLLNDKTVLENVALPLVIAGYRYQEIGKRVRAALDKVGLLSREKSRPNTLSAGEKQRVGIARALVSKPPLILADEPTGNLDPDLAADIMILFEQFNQAGVTILIASHDLRLINQLHHRRLTLKDGQLISDEEGYIV
ncbi:MAG: Cell division ATP-binding protein FtsE [uncultured bacterium]|nr:MAG: Cell division ATP-binding protein FtsE [uncultured bacterium]OGT29892.1 MAG: cell division ATP-binding protein FtsE [Gammaproteobacteria bacterium RIFCSPHIGHO2_12_FULL_35_23]